MKENVKKAITKQINEELFSAYAYLAIAAKAENLLLPGFSSWFKVQAQEEIDHAMGFFNHLAQRNEIIELDALAKPNPELSNAASLVAAGLDHEKHITATIHALSGMAKAEGDTNLVKLLEWYIEEQAEEEETLGDLLERVKTLREDREQLKELDEELARREHHPSSILSYRI